jgi:hypothetical protein
MLAEMWFEKKKDIFDILNGCLYIPRNKIYTNGHE